MVDELPSVYVTHHCGEGVKEKRGQFVEAVKDQRITPNHNSYKKKNVIKKLRRMLRYAPRFHGIF
jgi:hypothetical protein